MGAPSLFLRKRRGGRVLRIRPGRGGCACPLAWKKRLNTVQAVGKATSNWVRRYPQGMCGQR